MPLHVDVDAGRAEWLDDPRWRCTLAALDRLTGEDVSWRTGPHDVRIAHLPTGTVVAVLRRYVQHRRWSLNVEGFEFHQFVRLLGRETWTTPMGFDRISAARAFADTVLRQAGATVRRG